MSLPLSGERAGLSGAVARLAGKKRSAAWSLSLLASAVGIATLLRIAAGLFVSGVPFIFFFPAIIAVAALTDAIYGVAAVILSAVLSWALFLNEPDSAMALTRGTATNLVLFVLAGLLIVWVAQLMREALRRAVHSEARASKLLGVASGIVWVTDGEGRALEANPAWAEVTGMQWPDYSGHGWAKAIHPEDLTRLRPVHGVEYHEAEFRLWHAAAGDWRWFHSRAVMLPQLSGTSEEWITALRDIHDQKLAEDKRDLVIGELRHRMKNLVTIIDVLAKMSKTGDDPQTELFLRKFLGRLHALGGAADLVLAGQRAAIECSAVVRTTLAPFAEEFNERFAIAGPIVQLSEETGGGLAMAIHELATNAIKYGALSVPDGRVSVEWTLTPSGDERLFSLTWKERGGPRPSPPNHEGFGSRVIRSVSAREKNGEVNIAYEADGLSCRISFLRAADGPPKAVA